MRTLYHFEQSVFSRRTRLALALKGIEVELRDGRVDPAHLAAARSVQPLRTMPVLVEEDGHALADSVAIVQYLDIAYPDAPRLVPLEPKAARDALSLMAAVDVAMNAVVDLGTRLFELRSDPAWSAMKDERMARAQHAIDFVATHLVNGRWNAADIWVYSAARWVDAWPGRVSQSPAVANMVTLGFTLPPALVAWSEQHANRPGVRALYG